MPTLPNTTVQPVVEGAHLSYEGSGDYTHVDFTDIIEALSDVDPEMDILTLRNIKITDSQGFRDDRAVLESFGFRLKRLYLYEVAPIGTDPDFLQDFLALFEEIDEIMFVGSGTIALDVQDPTLSEKSMNLPWPPPLNSSPTTGGNIRVQKLFLRGQLPPGVLPGDLYRAYWTRVYDELRASLHHPSLIEFVTVDNLYPFTSRKTLEHLTFSPRNYNMIYRGAQPVLPPDELWLLEGFSSLRTLELYNVAVGLPAPENATLESHTSALTNALLSVGFMLQNAPHQTLETVSVYLVYPFQEACAKYRLGDSGYWSTFKHFLQSVVCQSQFQTFRIVLPPHCPTPERTMSFLRDKLATGEFARKFEVIVNNTGSGLN